MNINIFFTTPLGSFVKVFLGAMIVFLMDTYLSDGNVFVLDKTFLQSALKSGVIAIAPMIYNYLNPKYDGYGRKGIDPLKPN
tara:strand:- start:21407 stop:21652 length:246 start_codon:yes stop_codon:yes gene_type:complete